MTSLCTVELPLGVASDEKVIAACYTYQAEVPAVFGRDLRDINARA